MSAILKNRSAGGGNRTYVDFNGKEGNFIYVDRNTKQKLTFDQLDYAYPKKLEFKEDMFDGQPVYKAQLHLEGVEDGSHVVMTFKLGTFIGAKMLGLLNAATEKPEVPVRFNTGITREGEKLMNDDVATKDFVWVSARHEGAQETLKPKYDTEDGLLPKAIEVSLGGGKKALNMEPIDNVATALFAKVAERLASHAQRQIEQNSAPAEGDHADAADLPGTQEPALETPRG
jgi:hypothetical protein